MNKADFDETEQNAPETA